MSTRHTDVLIIGGELAGAVAAAVCARAGKRVVVLEEGEGDDALTIGNVVAPPPGEFFPCVDLLPRAMGPLEALGQKQDIRRTIPLSTMPLQVLHPHHRLDLFQDATQRAQDIKREVGDAGGRTAETLDTVDESGAAAMALLDLLDPFIPVGFFADRRTRARYRATLGSVREVAAYGVPQGSEWLASSFSGAAGLMSHASQLPTWAAVRLVRATLGGLHVAPQGVRNALRVQLLDAARQRGAEIIKDDRATALVVESGRIAEVRLTQRQDGLAAKAVVDATWGRDLRERLSPEKHTKKMDAAMASCKVELGRVSVAWLVRKKGLPAGLAERALLAPMGTGPGQGAAYLAVTRAPLHVETRKPQQELAVITLCTVAAEADGKAAFERLTQRLETLFPFTRAHLVEAKAFGPERFKGAHGAVYGGPADPAVLGGRGTSGGLKGLYRAGRDVAPALGVEGELWSGFAAGTLAEKLVSKRPWWRAAPPPEPATALLR